MTLFQEAAAAGERGAGAPGGAHRHLPPPAAPAALAPPREATPPSMRGLWPPRYKGAAVPGLSSGGATAYRAKASLRAASRQTAALLCHAATGHSRGPRASHLRAAAGRRADRGSFPYPWPPAPFEGTQCPIGLWRPEDYPGGAKILGQAPSSPSVRPAGRSRARLWEPTPQAAYGIRGERRH